VWLTALSKLELGQWHSALIARSGPFIQAIIEVNELESANSALVALILLSIVVQASFRKILIAIVSVVIPVIEGQVSDLLIGWALAFKIFTDLGFFETPVFLLDPGAQLRQRVYRSNVIAVVLWDLMICCNIVMQVRNQVWQLVGVLVICFCTYLVLIVWVCIHSLLHAQL
jgi:hypothetical protein